MLKKNLILLFCLALFACMLGAYGFDLQTSEIYRIRIQNQPGGLVQVSLNGGKNYQCVGRVTTAANARIPGFNASAYTPQGTVAATAVHGIRIKTGQFAQGSGKAQEPMIFSITPSEFGKIPRGYGGHRPRSSGILTDIYAGFSIFRNQSPYVGNPVFVERGHKLINLPEDYIPIEGETFVIIVKRPVRMPSEIIFENKSGGEVTAVYPDGAVERIADVDRPVSAIGRYDGTTFTGVGTINTNHGGVLTISTAPVCRPGTCEGGSVETRGGFMVQPYFHVVDQGESKGQVMVVGPKDRTRPRMEGTPPLFFGYFNLAYMPDHPENSYRTQIKIDDGDWENVPKIVGKVDNAFTPAFLESLYSNSGQSRTIKTGVTAIRILFPKYDPKLAAKDLAKEVSSYTARASKAGIKTVYGTFSIAPQNPRRDADTVNVYVDGNLVDVSNKYPYKIIWNSTNAGNGLHTLNVETVVDSNATPIVETRQVFIKN